MQDKRTPLQIEEDAADAAAILADPGFQRLMRDIRSEWLAELTSAGLEDLTAQRAHANIRGLDALVERLKSRITDRQFAAKRGN